MEKIRAREGKRVGEEEAEEVWSGRKGRKKARANGESDKKEIKNREEERHADEVQIHEYTV